MFSKTPLGLIGLILVWASLVGAAPASGSSLPEKTIHSGLVFDGLGDTNVLPTEPAGCLSAPEAVHMDLNARLAYAKSLTSFNYELFLRPLSNAWNAISGVKTSLPEGMFAFLAPATIPFFEVDSIRRAFHVGGFAAWMRLIPNEGLQILLIYPTAEVNVRQEWLVYYQQYWENPSSPAFDPLLFPLAPQLPLCKWMVDAGLSPSFNEKWYQGWSWEYPDYSPGLQKYLANNLNMANQIAYKINWIANGDVESASNMCGPLTWSITHDAGGFPPGFGEWLKGPLSFWLPNPKITGRPWSLFPPDQYHRYRFSTPLNQFSFVDFPLLPGDIVYAFAEGDGDDHVFAVVDRDLGGRVYTVSNLVKMQPIYQVTIEYSLLYDPQKPDKGVIKNEWSDIVNGRTGQNGFEVFRWKWLEKDLYRREIPIKVVPGDTLFELALKWKTPPGLILERNQINASKPLSPGQRLTIPPRKISDRYRLDLPIALQSEVVFPRIFRGNIAR